MTYQRTLEEKFADTLEQLRTISPKTEIINTGGGCMAIEVPVGADHYFLMTDSNSGVELPKQEEGARWMLGFYDNETDQLDLGEGLSLEDVIAIVAAKRPHRAALVDAMKDLESKAAEALNAWYNVEAAGDGVPVDGYPFGESFEEVVASIGAFREKLQEWAK